MKILNRLPGGRRVAICGLLALALAGGGTAGFAAELHGYAFVQEDGSLRVRNTRVHLYGIHIPDTGRTCRFSERPVRCAPRATLALAFKIRGFVRCEVVARHDDGSVTGRCRVGDDDLSAYLLERGWALALPDAPFAYQARERIARHRSLGVWGQPVDNLRQAPAPPE